MAKKPAESDESETGSASEPQGSDADTLSDDGGSKEKGKAKTKSDHGQVDSGEDAKSDEGGEDASEEKPKKKTISARTKRATGKQAAVRTTRAAPRGSGHELVPVICSECYEELVFDSGVSSDVLTCPICEHQAARPDDAQLAVIAEKRGQEKTNFTICLALCMVSIAAFGLWIWLLRNPHTNANENNAGFYGPVVISLLAYLGCLGFTLGKYESARHDVYF